MFFVHSLVVVLLAMAGHHATPALTVPAEADPAVVVALATPLGVGDAAPDFTFRSWDEQWVQLHDVVPAGAVLLVIAPTDAQRATLERDRERLQLAGVRPIAVLAQRDGETWRTVQREHLDYSVLSDPGGDVAGQFGALDAWAGLSPSAWFVVDAERHVRGAGLLAAAPGDWLAVVAPGEPPALAGR